MTIHETPTTASAETMADTSKQHPRAVSRRSVVAAGSLAALAPTLLAACDASEGGGGTGGATELTFMNQSRGQEAALTALAEKYSEENGITITIDSPGPADYLPSLQARAQSRDMPDIYSAFNATDMAPFYKAGWATDFSAELDAGWKDNFSPAVLALSTFAEGNNLDVEPGVYTVHWETQTYGILVNPELTGIAAGTETLSGDELIDALGLGGKDAARWPTMSQGERGRALIARALLMDPPLLLLDEPSTGLDVAAREQLLETVDHLHTTHPDLATVLVTHHLEELPETTTHAMLLKDGRVRAAGPADDVLTTELVTDAFDYPIDIARSTGRWSARARRAVPAA